jgi:uncharacterized protein YijF (DUF1287 family)
LRKNLSIALFYSITIAGLIQSSVIAIAGRYPYNEKFSSKLVEAALERTRHKVVYDGSYRKIGYPGGDVPDRIGVCTDVIIRAYRGAGVDLQKEVHEDMRDNFSLYPHKWGLNRPDTNIDHRRVPNLQVFFRRLGIELPVTRPPGDYLPGDLVTWTVQGNLPHIGIVSDKKALLTRHPLIIHNIGRGPVLEDMLFEYPVTGHYRYYGNR